MFDFDQVIDRRRTNAMAIDGYDDYLFRGDDPVTFPNGPDDVVSMWVADMAFGSCPAAIEAMRARLDHPIFGYSAVFEPDLYEAFAAWCVSHYGWTPVAEHLVSAPGVVPALRDLVEYVLGPDDKVVTLTPAYGMFKNTARHHDREVVTVALGRDESGRYQIDFDAFEAAVERPDVTMFFLCHPHNPTGRAWTEEELRALTDRCLANDVLVISDEIHCDLLRVGGSHTPLATLYPESTGIVTTMSASKTFNLAGLGLAQIVIPDEELRSVWKRRTPPLVNPLSHAAVVGAFGGGEPWRQALREYLDANFAHLARRLADELPDAGFTVPEATYLAWIDLAAYVPDDRNLTRWFAERAGVLVEGPDMFVADAGRHIRVNLACPRSTLDAGIDRIVDGARQAAG